MRLKIKMKAEQKRKLIEASRSALNAAYSPYSKIRVGSAVLTNDGQIFSGCNVENASYGATICAERTAIFKAISEGAKSIKGVVVMTESRKPWAPCGLCRQVILEFASAKTPVILANTKGKQKLLTVGELCPHSFSPKQMP